MKMSRKQAHGWHFSLKSLDQGCATGPCLPPLTRGHKVPDRRGAINRHPGLEVYAMQWWRHSKRGNIFDNYMIINECINFENCNHINIIPTTRIPWWLHPSKTNQLYCTISLPNFLISQHKVHDVYLTIKKTRTTSLNIMMPKIKCSIAAILRTSFSNSFSSTRKMWNCSSLIQMLFKFVPKCPINGNLFK